MRKAVISVAAAALPFLASLDASAASAGTLDFTVSTDAAAEESKQKKAPKSFVALILENVGLKAESDETYIVTAMASQEPAKAKEGCPEAEEQKIAKPEGAAEEEKKDVVGPEPLYFAF